MRLKLVFFAIALSGPLASGLAQAQFMGRPGVPDPVPPPPGGAWTSQNKGPPYNPKCEPLCPNDFSPCDPIYFKTEDGRCDGIGGFR
ncbi:hypothetical protein [Methylocapsa aurea]|uniref:hypothetical protein n=1 Tax=Methylocapsa aurea TaxID=663610 RepID=UPI0005688870|nr:hypothetical protein [Methylocapsa aurea]